MVAGTVQNTTSAVPVRARKDPPEGQMAVPLSFAFTPSNYAFTNFYQLGGQSGGIMISQVVSLLIDNTASPYPTTVQHGVTNSTVTIPAFTEAIIPTFSSATSYPLSLAQATAPV